MTETYKQSKPYATFSASNKQLDEQTLYISTKLNTMTMEATTNDIHIVSSADALWSLIISQPKRVQKILWDRMKAKEAENKEPAPKVKMTKKEYFDMLEESIKSGVAETMEPGESGEEFLDRILNKHGV